MEESDLVQKDRWHLEWCHDEDSKRYSKQGEDACKELGLRLFVLPPRSPKLNGHVEMAQRTHTEEFYEIYGDPDMGPLNQALRNWEEVYNTVRPSQPLGYLTPLRFLHHQYKSNKGLMCHPSTERVQSVDLIPLLYL